jgi:hypothetical protein
VPTESYLGGFAAVLALSACAGAPPPGQARLDAAFARIQVAEARIEHARADVAREEHGCAHVREAQRDVQAARAELCRLAREIADADALIRCEHAARSSASIAHQADRRCSPAQPHAAARVQAGSR